MLNINNQVFITLKIDGKAVEYVNVKDMTLAEGNGAYAPTMKLELDDPTSLLSKDHALSEGNTVELLISKSMNDAYTVPRKYRIFGPTRDNNSNNPNVSIVGLLNAPLYFTASARESYVGTSDCVLKKIADKVGLTYSGPTKGRTLNDKQTWWDVCSTRAKFAYEVTRNAYIDDRSAMESVVTSTHDLVYRNVIDEINTPAGQIKFVFQHSALDNPSDRGKKVYIVKEARDKSSSGAMTHWVNYGSTRANNNMDGVQKNRKSVDVKTPGAYLAINQEVTDMIKRTRFDYAPIDCSNTHKNYQDAWYQNIKLLALFTETMSLLVTDVTDIKLMDPLIYRQADADPHSKVRNEDIYILVGKTIVVRGGIHYAERLQCARISLTMKGEASLKTNLGDGGYSQSIVPESTINSSAFGSNFGSLSSMSGITQVFSNINNQLGSITSGVTSIISSALSPITSVLGAISGGQSSAIQSALGLLTSPLQGLTQQIGSLAQITSPAQGSLEQMSNLVCLAPPGYANAALTQPNGIMDILSSAMQGLAMAGQLSSTAQGLYNTLPGSDRASIPGVELLGQVQQATQGMQSASGTVSSLWNTLVSNVGRQSIPDYGGTQSYPGYSYPSTPTYAQPQTYSTQATQSNLLMRLMLMLVSTGGAPTQDAIMLFLQGELQQQSFGQPNYTTANEFVLPASTVAKDLSTLATLSANMATFA